MSSKKILIFEFEGVSLCQAIEATFKRRRTPVPDEIPLAFTPEFFEDRGKQIQWRAFLSKGKLETDGKIFHEVIAILQDFLMPPSLVVALGKTFSKIWQPPKGWQ